MEIATTCQGKPLEIDATSPAQRSGHIANVRGSYMPTVKIDYASAPIRQFKRSGPGLDDERDGHPECKAPGFPCSPAIMAAGRPE